MSETHIFSPTVLNTFRFSFSRTNLRTDSPSGVIGPEFSHVAGEEVANISIGGLTSFNADNASPSHNKQNIFTWSDDLFYTRGRHALKFGTLVNRYQLFTRLALQSRGNIVYTDLEEFLAGDVLRYGVLSPGSLQQRSYEFTTLGFYAQDDFRLRPNLTLNLGLRYEFVTVPQEVSGMGSNLRDIARDTEFTVAPGLWENPSLGNISPRFGFAWDVRGDGKMAVRGGFGMLYDIASFGTAMLSLAASTPPFSSLSEVLNFPLTELPIVVPPEALGKAVRITDYNLKQPHMLQYNLTVERQLPSSMAITLAYAGSRGLNLFQHKEGNPRWPEGIPVGQGAERTCFDPDSGMTPTPGLKCWTGNEPARNPAWTYIRLNTAAGNSWYNSLQFGLKKRMSHGLQFQSSYTWSKVIDDTQGIVPADSSGDIDMLDPSEPSLDRAPAKFDIAHNYRFNAIYRLPQMTSGGAVAKLLNGWWISSILSLETGNPFSVANSRQRNRSGNNNNRRSRPDLAPGVNHEDITRGVSRGCGTGRNAIAAGTPVGTPERWFDPCAFQIQNIGFIGTAGRNILRQPGLANLDFSVVKDTPLAFLGESGKVEFRAEFFNIFNNVNFGRPSTSAFSASCRGQATGCVETPRSTAGRISSAATSRQIQLALKIIF